MSGQLGGSSFDDNMACQLRMFGGPKGEKRPADVIGNAVRVMQIATGEREEENEALPEKDESAVALGRKGGVARARVVTLERRT